MTKQEKLAMIKNAIQTLSKDPGLESKAKERGIKSLKEAYRKYNSNPSL